MYDKVKGNPSLGRVLFKAKAAGLLYHRQGSTLSIHSGGQWVSFFKMGPFTVCRATPRNPRTTYRTPAFYCDGCGGTRSMAQYGGVMGSPVGVQLVCKTCLDNRASGKAKAKVKAKPVADKALALPAKDGPSQAVCSIIEGS